jgi:folate-dependent phosphoribosylglycinamide formyltransferase PurN
VATLDLGVLVSGNGTNLQAILDAVAEGSLNARVRVVISNRPGVRAPARAFRRSASRIANTRREKTSTPPWCVRCARRVRASSYSPVSCAC